MSGTWTKAAAECDCHWGDWGRAQADWMALVGPSAQILLLRGDSRAGGNNPHGQGLSAGVRQHLRPVSRAVTPRPPWQHWNCVPWWLLWSLCPWHWLALSVWGTGAEELLGFGSCQSQALLTPLYPCWAQGLGTAVCPLHVLLSCPTLWAGAWAGLCSRTGMSCSSPTLGLANSPHPTAALGGREVASLPGFLGATRRSGAVETPVTAEPVCVSSDSLFRCPGFGDAAPRRSQCSTPSFAPSLPWGFHPKQPWDTLACPPLLLPAGNSAVPARAVGEFRAS